MEQELVFGKREMRKRNQACLSGLSEIERLCEKYQKDTSGITTGVLYANYFPFERFRAKYTHLIEEGLLPEAKKRAEMIRGFDASGQQNRIPTEADIVTYYQGEKTNKKNEDLVKGLEKIYDAVDTSSAKVGEFLRCAKIARERTKSAKFSASLRSNVPEIEGTQKLVDSVYLTSLRCASKLLPTNEHLVTSGYTCMGVGFIKGVDPDEIERAARVIPRGETFENIWKELGNMERTNPDIFK